MIIDTHVHLNELENLDDALKRARVAGVDAIIAAGADDKSNKKILEICRTHKNSKDYPAIFPSLGLHPRDIIGMELEPALRLIEENIENIVAVGEIGMDFWYKEARKDENVRKLQEDVFVKQIELAKKWGKPIVVHSRGTHEECFRIVAESGIHKAVFHWYSGPEDILDNILNKGYLISATPSLEYSMGHKKAVEKAPLERILLETDSPVVFKPETGKYNSEPKDVVRTLKAVAKIKGLPQDEVAKKTTKNAVTFFNLPL